MRIPGSLLEFTAVTVNCAPIVVSCSRNIPHAVREKQQSARFAVADRRLQPGSCVRVLSARALLIRGELRAMRYRSG
jgi:hypothetical protein